MNLRVSARKAAGILPHDLIALRSESTHRMQPHRITSALSPLTERRVLLIRIAEVPLDIAGAGAVLARHGLRKEGLSAAAGNRLLGEDFPAVPARASAAVSGAEEEARETTGIRERISTSRVSSTVRLRPQ